MHIIEVDYAVGDVVETLYMRDTHTVGPFLWGIECDHRGIAVRQEGCTGSERVLKSENIREMRWL